MTASAVSRHSQSAPTSHRRVRGAPSADADGRPKPHQPCEARSHREGATCNTSHAPTVLSARRTKNVSRNNSQADLNHLRSNPHREDVAMATTADTTNRTELLLELMTKGDDAFNTRDFEAV